MTAGLLSITTLAERLHRRTLEVLDRQLTELGYLDLNATQAMILMHMGTEQMSVTELMTRGYYQGTNVSYNLKKLIQYGYIAQERAQSDHRMVHIKATRKGRQLVGALEQFYAALERDLEEGGKLNLAASIDRMAAIERLILERNSRAYLSEAQGSRPNPRRTERKRPQGRGGAGLRD
jgi:DNA-binding MarR family transcriptional regulator